MRKRRIKYGKGSRIRTRLLFTRNAELLAKAIARIPVDQFLFDSPDVVRLKKNGVRLMKKLRLEHE
jgi:hypothetical protein